MRVKLCSVDECSKPAAVRGLCHKHYARWQRHGDTHTVKKGGRTPQPKAKCSVPECLSGVDAKGLCPVHYMRFKRTGDPLGLTGGPWAGYIRPICPVDGCEAVATRRTGMCITHTRRLERTGSTDPVRRAPWSGDVGAEIRVNVQIARSGCWIWTGTMMTTGYGQLGHDYAHRHAYRFFVGRIRPRHTIHHTCEVKACVNPAHLMQVTPAEHMAIHWRLRRLRKEAA